MDHTLPRFGGACGVVVPNGIKSAATPLGSDFEHQQ